MLVEEFRLMTYAIIVLGALLVVLVVIYFYRGRQ